ncbi:aggrecan core protein [Plakobranchus ocellatus]|uniref:Aggrecan core protein n=1 Tax=Plakobranchus ocellatus TaxID=259542 RepID=A0AAV4C7N5_9GAST|nr:aggrecan core protein [Plakobranchus ocellatus]
MYSVAFILPVLLAIAAANDINTICPSELVKKIDPYYLSVKNGSCFHFVLYKKKAYSDANDECRDDGGTLALAKTKELNDYLSDKVLNFYLKRDEVWIGLHDKSNENTFVWEDGEKMEWNNFDKGNGPDNNFAVRTFEDCVALDVKNSKWHDFQCVRSPLSWISGSEPRKKYICQYTPSTKDTEGTKDSQDGGDKDEDKKTQDQDDKDTQESSEDDQQGKDTDGTHDSQGGGDKDEDKKTQDQDQDDKGTQDKCPPFICDEDCKMDGYKMTDEGCLLCECNSKN